MQWRENPNSANVRSLRSSVRDQEEAVDRERSLKLKRQQIEFLEQELEREKQRAKAGLEAGVFSREEAELIIRKAEEKLQKARNDLKNMKG